MLAQRDDKFYNELRQLNQDLGDYLKKCLDKSPYFDFTPTLQDYCKQFKEIESKFSATPPTTNSTTNNASTTASSNTNFAATFSLPNAATTTTASTTTSSFTNPLNSTSFTNPTNSVSFNNPINPVNFSNPNSSTNTYSTSSSTTSAAPIFGSAVVSTSGSLFGMPTAAPTPSSTATSATTTTTASTSTTTTTASSTPFIFGAPSSIPKPVTSTPFLFGVPSTTTTAGSGFGGSSQPAAPFFSFTAPKINTEESKVNDTTQADDEEEHHPPEPKVDKYEEPDSTYQVKCKLYEKGNKTASGEIPVTLLGIGTLFVKSLDSPAKLQVIVRQEPDLRRILMNEVITPSIPVKLLPKAVQMIFPGASGENKFFIAKVKDENDANTLFGFLNLSK